MILHSKCSLCSSTSTHPQSIRSTESTIKQRCTLCITTLPKRNMLSLAFSLTNRPDLIRIPSFNLSWTPLKLETTKDRLISEKFWLNLSIRKTSGPTLAPSPLPLARRELHGPSSVRSNPSQLNNLSPSKSTRRKQKQWRRKTPALMRLLVTTEKCSPLTLALSPERKLTSRRKPLQASLLLPLPSPPPLSWLSEAFQTLVAAQSIFKNR